MPHDTAMINISEKIAEPYQNRTREFPSPFPIGLWTVTQTTWWVQMWESDPLIFLLVIDIAMQGFVAPSVNCMWRAVGYECSVISLLVRLPGRVKVGIIGGSFPVWWSHSSHLALNSILEWSKDQPRSSKYRLERTHGTVRTQLRSDHCQGWSELYVATFLQQWEQKLSLGNTGGPPCNPTKCSTATRANPSYHFIGMTLMRQSDNIKLHCLISWWCAKQPLRAWEEKLCLSFCYTIFAVVSQSLWLGFISGIQRSRIYPRCDWTFREDLLFKMHFKAFGFHYLGCFYGAGGEALRRCILLAGTHALEAACVWSDVWEWIIKQGGNGAHGTEEKSSQTTEFLNLGVE